MTAQAQSQVQALTASSPPSRGGFRVTPSALILPALLYLIATTQVPVETTEKGGRRASRCGSSEALESWMPQ